MLYNAKYSENNQLLLGLATEGILTTQETADGEIVLSNPVSHTITST